MFGDVVSSIANHGVRVLPEPPAQGVATSGKASDTRPAAPVAPASGGGVAAPGGGAGGGGVVASSGDVTADAPPGATAAAATATSRRRSSAAGPPAAAASALDAAGGANTPQTLLRHYVDELARVRGETTLKSQSPALRSRKA